MDEDKMRQFNEAFGGIEIKKDEVEPVTPYRAVGNLNTALNNPNMNAGSMMGSNIQNQSQIDNSMSVNNLLKTKEELNQIPQEPKVQTQQQTAPVQNIPVDNFDPNSLDVTERAYEHAPIRDLEVNRTTTFISNQNMPKQKKKVKIKISKDTQVIILMILVIFIFVMILPTVFDFIQGLRGY